MKYPLKVNYRHFKAMAEIICRAFGVTLAELHSTSRRSDVALARHVFCYTAYAMNHGVMHIGAYLQRDHATIIYGRDKVQNMLFEPAFHARIKRVLEEVQQVPRVLPLEVEMSRASVASYGYLSL